MYQPIHARPPDGFKLSQRTTSSTDTFMKWKSMFRFVFIAHLLFLLSACGGGGSAGNSASPSQPSLPSNRAPVVNAANADQSAVTGQSLSYDALQGGNTFSDPDGDALTYVLEVSEGYGLSATGTQITGTPSRSVDTSSGDSRM